MPIPDKLNRRQSAVDVADLVVLSPPKIEDAAKACPLLDGDREAWIACCTKRFLRLAASLAGGDEQAEDALQESWIKILQEVRKYRGGPPACSWVRSIVANSAKDVRRAGSRTVTGVTVAGFEEPAADPEAAARQKQLYRLLDAMVKELPPIYRQVVDLRYEQELSTQETADLLHISRANVSARLSRAVKMLRHSLAARTGGETPS